MRERPLHVVLAAPAYPPQGGGLAVLARELALGLAERGCRVTVLVPPEHPAGAGSGPETEPGFDPDPDSPDFDPGAGPRLLPLPVPRRPARHPAGWPLVGHLERSRAARRRLVALHREHPVDVVEFSNWGAWGLVHGLFPRVPQVTRLTTGIHQIGPPPGRGPGARVEAALRRILGGLEALAVRRSDHLVSISAGHWRQTRHLLGLGPADDDRHTVVPPCVPRPPLAADGPPRDRPASGPERLLFVGRLTRRKGLDVFLEAVARLEHREIEVRIVGDDAPAPDGGPSAWCHHRERLAPRLGERVHYRGALDAAGRDREYRDADILVAPSRYESFGLVSLEAMHFALPVVACRVGGVPEVVVDGATGLLVEPGDPVALAAALETLLDDPARRRALGQAGRRRAGSVFTRRALADGSLDAYRAAEEHAARRRARGLPP